ncbi:MAG: M56 family metallopeptidase [Bacillota bacterium]|nr:M56 family metallopeptidase [Bacillota bacterium]
MSLTASYVALGVMIVRLLLRKAPKSFSYGLWGIVLFRLLCPFSFESPLSLIPRETAVIPHNIVFSQNPAIKIGIIDSTVNQSIYSSLPTVNSAVSVNPMAVVMEIAAAVWLLGIALLLCYSAVSYFRLKNRLSTATLLKEKIFETDRIQIPFVLGFVKPGIYIPTGLAQKELDYILEHEQIHIKRRDYLIKPVAFLALILHWFNPLIWVGYFLVVKDMEMSCDESVMKQSDRDIKKSYSNSLLTLSVKQSGLLSPLAFGERDVKSRIKNVLNYKKPAFWVSVVAVALVVTAALGLLANPIEDITYENDKYGFSIILPKDFSENIVIREEESVVYFNNKEIQEMFPDMNIGVVGRIEIYDKKEASKESLKEREEIYNLKYLGENENYYFGWAHASDVQISSNEQIESYRAMEEEFERIIKTFKIYNGFNSSVSNVGGVDEPISVAIEKNLSAILSSPKESSNPQDYINAHKNEYENILKLGDEALNYLLSQFGNGQDPFAAGKGKGVRVNDDLRGHIMMRLCKEILGDRNNVRDETLSPQAWFSQLAIYEETQLPNFVYDGDDPIEKLVYDTEIAKYINPYRGGFIVVAPKIHSYYEEGSMLKVFVTTYYANYHFYDKVVSLDGAGIVPAAITYVKNENGNYFLEEYKQARDGSDFAKSIEDFCVMPVSGKKIAGLADKILGHYGNYGDIVTLQRENLIRHLKLNHQTGIKLQSPTGEIIPLT